MAQAVALGGDYRRAAQLISEADAATPRPRGPGFAVRRHLSRRLPGSRADVSPSSSTPPCLRRPPVDRERSPVRQFGRGRCRECLWPLSGGAGAGPGRERRHARAGRLDVGTDRASRSRCPERRDGAGAQCASIGSPSATSPRQRLEPRLGGPCAGPCERGRCRRRAYREAINRLSRTRLRPSSPVRTCSTGSGCAAKAGASMRALSSAPRTSSSRRSAWRRSPSAHAESCWRRARKRASGRSRRATI